ncbi:MAG: class II aldolase/adducin family protein [Acidimicrobiales bacterium]
MSYPSLRRDSAEPSFDDVNEERLHRKRQCALAYRAFGALGWGQLGDGHISVRDPEHPDSFWLLKLGVPFGQATVADLVLVGPDGSVAGGEDINMTAYYIHMPIHDARPEVMCVAHTHTAYGTPWSANVAPFRAISQEALSFVYNQSIFEGEELGVPSYECGQRIAEAMGTTSLCMLRNHGPLTAGRSVAEAVGLYVMAERVAEVHIKAPDAVAISDEAAKAMASGWAEDPRTGWMSFQYLLRTMVPDPAVVD